MTKFYFFRHGETDWNVGFRMQGHTDIPLNDRGREQAKALAETFRGVQIDLILASDLSRARETASYVVAATGAPLEIDPRLRETRMGQAEGMTIDEVSAAFGGDAVEKWRSRHPDHADYAFPDGENKADALARMRLALQSRAESAVAVCSHGGVLRRLFHWIKPGMSDQIYIQNCQLFAATYDAARWRWTPEF